MFIGAHSIIYSRNPDADRAFLRDVLGLPNVDVGEGWLIFGLPPSEVAVHPSAENNAHEFYLMCDDVEAFVADMKVHGVACSAVKDQGWGLLTQVSLPGGGRLGIYQPKHARPQGLSLTKAEKKPGKRAPKKPVRRMTVTKQRSRKRR
jgi:catechol 2,3-dioxygenase-like lactoylglutathione lyase family enzyme